MVPTPIVPEPIPLPELIAIAMLERPELAARRSEVQAALYEMSMAKVLPFSPNVILGFSTGGFGGGSNLVARPEGFIAGNGQRFTAPRFDSFNQLVESRLRLVAAVTAYNAAQFRLFVALGSNPTAGSAAALPVVPSPPAPRP